jgi:hypothetical protein
VCLVPTLPPLCYTGAADTTKRFIDSSYTREVGGTYVPPDFVFLTYTEWDAWQQEKCVCVCVLLAVFLICTEGYVWDNCGEGKGEGVHGNREREEERERQRGGEMRAVLLTCTEGAASAGPGFSPLPRCPCMASISSK